MECSGSNNEDQRNAGFRPVNEENMRFPEGLDGVIDSSCPACGVPFHPDMKFCQECGLEFEPWTTEKEMRLQKIQDDDPGGVKTFLAAIDAPEPVAKAKVPAMLTRQGAHAVAKPEAKASAGPTGLPEIHFGRKSVIEQAFTELSDALAKSSIQRPASAGSVGKSEVSAREQLGREILEVEKQPIELSVMLGVTKAPETEAVAAVDKPAEGVADPVKESPAAPEPLQKAESVAEQTVEAVESVKETPAEPINIAAWVEPEIPTSITVTAPLEMPKAGVVPDEPVASKQEPVRIPTVAEAREPKREEGRTPAPVTAIPRPSAVPERSEHTSITQASFALLVGVVVLGIGILFLQKPPEAPNPRHLPPPITSEAKVPEQVPEKGKEGVAPPTPAGNTSVAIDTPKTPGAENLQNAETGAKPALRPVLPPVASVNPGSGAKKPKGGETKVAQAAKKLVTAQIEQAPRAEQPKFDYTLAPQYGTDEDRRRAVEQLERIRALRLQQHSQFEKNQ